MMRLPLYIFCSVFVSLFSITSSLASDHKELRVLTWSGGETLLPREGHPQDMELQYLQQFAQQKGLTFKQISVQQFDQLFTKLVAGEGDLIAANLTETKARKERVNFTTPFLQSYEYLLMGKDSKALKSGKELNGREVVIQKGKSYESTALGLQKVYPKLRIRYIDNSISIETIYDRLASGEYDLTIQDNNLIQSALAYRDDIKPSLKASSKRNIAWAIAKNNKKLLRQLNHYLNELQLLKKSQQAHMNRWQRIKANNKIRFVLRNNLSSYYIWRGELLGFNFELAKRFAKEHKLRYEIIVAPDNVALLDYVIEGKADVALGFLTPTQARRNRGIDFSRPYHYASELVVGHADAKVLLEPKDLSGHSIYTRASSSYWTTAQALQKQYKGIDLIAVPENMETESIIEAVGDKEFELTIADSHIVDLEMTFRDDIQSFMALGEPKGQSWAVKKGDEALLTNINKFLKKHYKGLFYNVIYNKYFLNKKRLDKQYKGYSYELKSGELSPYDAIVKKHAKPFDFDWRLLVAQMHQESRFNPKAKSMAGAQGLFQVMPRTAQQLGIANMYNPEKGIEAGVRYMDWVRKRMQADEIPESQLIWFTLASYNAGAGHVRDAMRLARQKGWHDDIWFENVEKAMLLLSKPKYAAKARYGYVRGQEPVTYVREIKRRYDTYVSKDNHK